MFLLFEETADITEFKPLRILTEYRHYREQRDGFRGDRYAVKYSYFNLTACVRRVIIMTIIML